MTLFSGNEARHFSIRSDTQTSHNAAVPPAVIPPVYTDIVTIDNQVLSIIRKQILHSQTFLRVIREQQENWLTTDSILELCRDILMWPYWSKLASLAQKTCTLECSRPFRGWSGGGRVVRWGGWSGGAMVLGKLPVPGRPTNLDYSRARAYSACSRRGWWLFGHFSLVYHFSFLSPSLWETDRYRLKYYLKGPLSPKQPTNQQDH